jgi:hypothetical protein
MRRTIDVRLELGPVLGNATPFGKAEHLIAAAVGQDRTLPSDKTV